MSIVKRALAQGLRLVTPRNIEGRSVLSRRRAQLTVIGCYFGVLLSAVFATVALAQGHRTLGVIELAFCAVLGGIGTYIRLVRYHDGWNYLAGGASAAVFCYLLVTGGDSGSGHLLPLTFPLFALFIWGARWGALASLLLLGGTVVFFAFDRQLAIGRVYQLAFEARFVAVYGLILSFMYFFERTRETTQRQLAEQNLELERRVAELKVTDAALRESETLLKATLESTGDGILVLSTAGKVLATNEQLARMWRLPREALAAAEGARLLERIAEQHEDPEVFIARVKELGRQPGEWVSETLRLADGRVFEQTFTPLWVGGEVAGQVWTFRDVSERVQSERERSRLQAELQRSQKMEALGTLAGGVAHDLNNVLAGIVGYPDLLLMELADDSPLREDLLAIRASGTKAALIVQDLLTLARRGVPNKSVLNLNDVVEAYLRSPEHQDLLSFHPGVVLEPRLGADLLNLSAAEVQLNKVLMNLVSNAAEAMPDGGTIEIETCNRYIDTPVLGYDAVSEGEYVVLTIRDSGVGIAEDNHENIFDPFFTKKQMGRSGSGLGLSVVWGTVKDLCGHIDVQSRAGEGATFTLYFPATRAPVDVEQTTLAIETYRGKGESILVVDDAPEQREVASRILTALGYSVATATSGEEALVHLEQHQVDLLVLDMIMPPGLDGLETYKRVVERSPGQRAIIASGYSETDRVREALSLGVDRYLKKPYLLETIGLAVKDALHAQK